MATWNKIQIQRDNGMMAEAQAPIIISASRSTDIPAFYADKLVCANQFETQMLKLYFCRR